MSQAEAAHIANAVSAYATVLAGLLTIAFARMMTRQPGAWLAVYVCVLVTGVATVWYHGFGEPFPARVADIGTNLLLAWMIQVAVVGDLYPGRGGRLLNLVVALVNLEYILTFALSGGQGATPLVLPFGEFGGYTLGELLLIVNCFIAVTLLFARRREIHPLARPLLYLSTLIFFAGLLLSTASNSRIDLGIIAYHATWHIVGAFGFVALWAFNEMRFSLTEGEHAEEHEERADETRLAESAEIQSPADREQVFSY